MLILHIVVGSFYASYDQIGKRIVRRIMQKFESDFTFH